MEYASDANGAAATAGYENSFSKSSKDCIKQYEACGLSIKDLKKIFEDLSESYQSHQENPSSHI